jgi:hypothetical protein
MPENSNGHDALPSEPNESIEQHPNTQGTDEQLSPQQSADKGEETEGPLDAESKVAEKAEEEQPTVTVRDLEPPTQTSPEERRSSTTGRNRDQEPRTWPRGMIQAFGSMLAGDDRASPRPDRQGVSKPPPKVIRRNVPRKVTLKSNEA